MKKTILFILASAVLAACSTTGNNKNISLVENKEIPKLVNPTKKLYKKSVKNTSSAFKDYTKIIYQHSLQPSARYSYQVVQLCHLNKKGIETKDLITMIDNNIDLGTRCWESLLDYAKKDIRFYKKGKPEKQIFDRFKKNLTTYSSLFEMK